MKKINGLRAVPIVAVLGAMTCWSSVASADPITVDFEVTGFSGDATLSGWFTGEDTRGIIRRGPNGFLVGSELTAFELDWSGNSRVVAFSHVLSDLRSFLYSIGSNTLLGFESTLGGGRRDRPSASYSSFFGFPLVSVVRDRHTTLTFKPRVSSTIKVPEPGTLTLLGIGLIGLGMARRRTA